MHGCPSDRRKWILRPAAEIWDFPDEQPSLRAVPLQQLPSCCPAFNMLSCGFGLTVTADAEELPPPIIPLNSASVIAAFLVASLKKFPV